MHSLLSLPEDPDGVDETAVRRRALAAVHSGLLPCVPAQKTWGGFGTGGLCAVCGHPIEPTQMELELEFAATEVGQDVLDLYMHSLCFTAWDLARRSVASMEV